MTTYKALTEARAALVEKAKDHLKACKANEEGWNGEDKQTYQNMRDEIDALAERAKLALEVETAEAELNGLPSPGPAPEQRGSDESHRVERRGEYNHAERNEAFRDWLLCGDTSYRSSVSNAQMDRAKRYGFSLASDKTVLKRNYQAPRNMQEALELRANTTDSAAAGLNYVPDEMMAGIDLALVQYGGMYNFADRIVTNTGADLPIPKTDDTSNTGELMSNQTTAATSLDLTTAQTVLQAYNFSSKIVTVSKVLLEDSAVNIPTLLGELLGIRLARITNSYFSTGTGSSQPQGIAVAGGAATASIAQATANTFTFGEIIDLEHSVNAAYRTDPSCAFMGADRTLGQLKKIADGQGRPLWLPALAPGGIPLLDGFPFVINADAPTGSSARGLFFGAGSRFKIREVNGIQLVRMDERYAEYNQVAFVAWMRADSDITQTAAVKYMTFHASST